jgi:hypothetical protein
MKERIIMNDSLDDGDADTTTLKGLFLLSIMFFSGNIITPVIVILTVIFAFGNFWYPEKNLIEILQRSYPEAEQIVKTERNLFADSVITAKMIDAEGNETTKTFCLDTSILGLFGFGYKFTECPPESP